MKLKMLFLHQSRVAQAGSLLFRRLAICLCACCFIVQAHAATNYTAHEWGTFTSVQGGDGKLLFWRPLKNSELPGFVYNWQKAGMNRGTFIGGKAVIGDASGMATLQRMETPVIYFYADQVMNVDVDVAFPKGFLTEWYPQASQIGPSFPRNTNESSSGILSDSRAIWRNLEIVPKSKYAESLQESLPQDSSGIHYFAARETSASLVHADFSSPTNHTSEVEKFIFYRGAGSFATPLRVTVDSNNTVTVENDSPQPLGHLFLLNIHGGRGAFGVMDELAPSNSVTWLQMTSDFADHWNQFPLPQFQAEIAAQMQNALISEGLFPDEAKAMVNTWKDSWFTEEGARVLYILPRAWTDETLPMKLNPEPKDLTRVMVGRAEIITPDAETGLVQLLAKAQNGDAAARLRAAAQLKKFGRFVDPALQLVNTYPGHTNLTSFAYQLLFPPQSPFE